MEYRSVSSHIATDPAVRPPAPPGVSGRIGDQRTRRAQPPGYLGRQTTVELPPRLARAAPYGAEGQVWILGCCMLACGLLTGPVTFIGNAEVHGLILPLYACRNCVALLIEEAQTWTRIRDGLSPPGALYDLVAETVARKAA